jgi:hypothetical protein
LEAVGNLVRTCRTEDGRGGFLVADCPANVGNRIENARLIAAAPELLDALVALVALAAQAYTVTRADGTTISHPSIAAALDAIDKATGGQS